MNVGYDNDGIVIRCYKCDKRVLRNLNVIFNGSTATIILWNEFQIFVYENLELECVSKVITPDFQIHNVIITNHYILCLDVDGKFHTTTLKFKNSGQKRIKYGFRPRLMAVRACSLYNEGSVLCLTFENESFFLNVHKLNTNFSLLKTAIVTSSTNLSDDAIDKYILKSFPINKYHMKKIEDLFKINKIDFKCNYQLVVLSFDGLTLYGCLFSTEMVEEEVNLIKLYTCPSGINNVDFIEIDNNLKILVALSMGTLVCLTVEEETTIKENEEQLKKAQIIHLNIALYKFLVYNQSIIYTDNNKMYKADNFLSSNVEFREIFVKNVKDFVKFGDQIICTTFNNTIYTFSLDHYKSYLPRIIPTNYCPAETIVENTEIIKKILSEVDKNEMLIKKHLKEKNYATAISLSNRQDIMDNVIEYKLGAYESYEEAVKECSDIILPKNFNEYLDQNPFYLVIKISTKTEHKLHDILNSSLGDLYIHVTCKPADQIAKTNTIKVKDVIKNINILVPLEKSLICTTEMMIEMKIMSSLPAIFDSNNKLWAVLYRNICRLTSDNFIKFNFEPRKVETDEEPRKSSEELLMDAIKHQHEELFIFTKLKPESRLWHMYIRLPVEYKGLSKESGTISCNSKKVNYFIDKFTSADFLNSKDEIILPLPIDDEELFIKVDNDGFSTPSVKITSNNVIVVMDVKNFLTDFLYHVYSDFEEGREYIDSSFYTHFDNNKRRLKNYLNNTSSADEDIQAIIEQFEKKIAGVLPA